MAGRDRKAKTAGRMDSGHAQLFDIGRKAKAEIAKAEMRKSAVAETSTFAKKAAADRMAGGGRALLAVLESK